MHQKKFAYNSLEKYSCRFNNDKGVSGTEEKVSTAITGEKCVNECIKRKEIDDNINGVTLMEDGGGGCWCRKNMNSVSKSSSTSTSRKKSCLLIPCMYVS